jgi:hypothetical protein
MTVPIAFRFFVIFHSRFHPLLSTLLDSAANIDTRTSPVVRSTIACSLFHSLACTLLDATTQSTCSPDYASLPLLVCPPSLRSSTFMVEQNECSPSIPLDDQQESGQVEYDSLSVENVDLKTIQIKLIRLCANCRMMRRAPQAALSECLSAATPTSLPLSRKGARP